MTTLTKRWVRERHPGGPDLEIPVAEAHGDADGPSVTVIAGMHAGEAAGMLGAVELIQRLERERVRGRIMVIPVLSMLAAFGRSMQLSPVDEREVHELLPGQPDTSYSAHLVDLLFRTIWPTDAVLDLHGGELVQDLTPFVGVPWIEDGPLWDRCFELATAFAVPFVCKRSLADVTLGLPRRLLEEGVPNVWTEIGRNGIAEPRTTRLQFRGALNALRLLGALSGSGRRHRPRLLGPRHWDLFADQSGLWRPAVRAGQRVARGQRLGELLDVFGAVLATYEAPAEAVVEYVCTSPPINADRRPHGNRWHQHLAKLVDSSAEGAAGEPPG